MHPRFIDTIRRNPRLARAVRALSLALMLLPVPALLGASFTYAPDAGILGAALAKSGSDGGGSGKGGDDGGDDSGGNSGSGKGDDSGGNSGPGKGDDKDDDKDDDGRSSSGQNRGQGSGDASRSRASGTRSVAITSHGIAVTYNDGARDEIRDGRYTYRESSGRVTVSRPATGADIALMKSIAQGARASGTTRKTGEQVAIVHAERNRTFARIVYSNGWIETISNNQYSLTDSFGRRVVTRAATPADRARLLKAPSR